MKTPSDVMCAAAEAQKQGILDAAGECCDVYESTTPEASMVAAFLHSPLGMPHDRVKAFLQDADVIRLRISHDDFMRDDEAYVERYQDFRKKAMALVLQNMVA